MSGTWRPCVTTRRGTGHGGTGRRGTGTGTGGGDLAHQYTELALTAHGTYKHARQSRD